ncbi:MAG: 16S rRNA (adenine(1518)-N(6)/adenine(1519)-N(6))-dimethyltransferase RsmA [Bacteroidota bacterium]
MSVVRPKKQLGQHFLKDQQIAHKIVKAFTDHFEGSRAIEIGPGTGVLTDHLVNNTSFQFQALDVDKESVKYLHHKHPQHQDRVILQDFLQSDLSGEEGGLGIIGNFPYNISSQIFFKVYDHIHEVSLVVGMIQKEVAERICEGPGSKTYGILSVLLQAFYEVEYLFTVEAHVFDPPPKVRSAVIRLKRNSRKGLDCDERLFKRVVKAGFQTRRKTLRNCLKGLGVSASLLEQDIFSKRAEQLSVEDFLQLTKMIEEDG